MDPHTHINPHAAASSTLADILGYHYYTELAHASGMDRERIEEDGLEPKERVGRLVEQLGHIDNTVQYSWLLEMCREFFDFEDDAITVENWEALYDASADRMAAPDWEEQVLEQSGLEQVYLTNDFDDPLAGFDTAKYVPCLRTDDLVFHFATESTRERLSTASDVSLVDVSSVILALGRLFDHFRASGARACAISLPPDFEPQHVSCATFEPLLQAILGGRTLTSAESRTVSAFIFWQLTQLCADHKLPFDLMIGVNRKVYPGGVFQGQDLFDKRTSLIQFQQLFNAFPQVTFPVSVLAQTSNQELVSYSWIFPNVVTNGHWWYSNVPAYIELDCRSRLQAVPKTKQIGYYSDMYKLEFALPKFRMYRRILAGVLTHDFVLGACWSERRAIELGELVLRGNVERIFGDH
ncbi:MAG: glucuronate isomerase [Planctomycetaceae bacterium]